MANSAREPIESVVTPEMDSQLKRRLNSILLIEDCEADCYLLKRIIKDLGVAKEVLVSRNGKEALERIGKNQREGALQPELIFLDINTPGMEGWDFLEEFDRLDVKTKADTVIVMLSGSLDPDDRERALSIPLVREYCGKPLTRAELRDIVNRHFA